MVAIGMQHALLAVVAMSTFWESSFAAPIPGNQGSKQSKSSKGKGKQPERRPVPKNRPADDVDDVLLSSQFRRLKVGVQEAAGDKTAVLWAPSSGEYAHQLQSNNPSSTTNYGRLVRDSRVRSHMTDDERRRGVNPNMMSAATVAGTRHHMFVPSKPGQGTSQNYFNNVEGPILDRQVELGYEYPRYMNPLGDTNNLNNYAGYRVGPELYEDRYGIPSSSTGGPIRGSRQLPRGAQEAHLGYYKIPRGTTSASGRRSSQDMYYNPETGDYATAEEYLDELRSCRKRSACKMRPSRPGTVDAPAPEKWFHTTFDGGKLIFSSYGQFAEENDGQMKVTPPPVEYLAGATVEGDGSSPTDVKFPDISQEDSNAVVPQPEISDLTHDESLAFMQTMFNNLDEVAAQIEAKSSESTTDTTDDKTKDNTNSKSKTPTTKTTSTGDSTDDAGKTGTDKTGGETGETNENDSEANEDSGETNENDGETSGTDGETDENGDQTDGTDGTTGETDENDGETDETDENDGETGETDENGGETDETDGTDGESDESAGESKTGTSTHSAPKPP